MYCVERARVLSARFRKEDVAAEPCGRQARDRPCPWGGPWPVAYVPFAVDRHTPADVTTKRQAVRATPQVRFSIVMPTYQRRDVVIRSVLR